MRTFHSRDIHIMKTLWNSMIQPHIDYCSQLWAPQKTGDKYKIEALLRTYTHMIPSISHLNYWQRLSAMRIYSQERRLERYRIIYIWKTIENIAPSIGVETYRSRRHGRLCKIPMTKQQVSPAIKTIREGSLQINGPKLFNSLPAHIRNVTECSVNCFKDKLDKYLAYIPDEPKIPGYPSETNSIMEQSCRELAQSVEHSSNNPKVGSSPPTHSRL